MTFDISQFGPIGGQASRGKAPQVFGYKTTDAAGDVDTSGYFNDIYNMLSVGDFILRVTLNSSGVPTTAGFHVVMSRASNVVDVSDAAALTITDAD